MAEFVECKVQEMIPELEELEALELLSVEEVKLLVQKKRNFEYKAMRMYRNKDDYVAYVMFEIEILNLILQRRKSQSNFQKFGTIEQNMQLRILRRLRMMTRKWPWNLDLWQLRIFFSKSRNMPAEVTSSYSEQLRYNPHEEDLWIAWAQWEIEGRDNFKQARTILLSDAPRNIKNSLKLTREYFRLELLYIEYLKKDSDGNELENMQDNVIKNQDEIMNCVLPEMIFNKAVEDIVDTELYFDFYFIADKFSFAHELRDKIYSCCLEKFSNDKIIWKLKGVRALSGLNEDLQTGAKSSEVITLSSEEKLSTILRVYDEAIDKIGIPFLSIYLDQLLDILHQCWGIDEFRIITFQKLFTVFENCSKSLSSHQYLLWYELASSSTLYTTSVLKKIIFEAKASYPNCKFINYIWLKCRLMIKPDLKINLEKFLKGLSGSIGAETCMEFVTKSTRMNKVKLKKLMKMATFHIDARFCKLLRINHLNLLKEDLKSCRQNYAKYRMLPPFSADLHCAYILIELKAGKKVPKKIRSAFRTAILQFGSSHIGLWLSFIEYERKYGDKTLTSRLNQEAQDNLTPEKHQRFLDMKLILRNLNDKKSDSAVVFEEDCSEDYVDINSHFWKEGCLGSILEDCVGELTFSENQERELLFQRLAKIIKRDEILKSSLSASKEESCWEKLLSFILGERISLSVKESRKDYFGIEQQTREFFQQTEKKLMKSEKHLKVNYLSDSLKTNASTPNAISSDQELSKILENCDILQPGFLQQKQVVPYHLGIRAKKTIRKHERTKTAGKGWFGMKAQEITSDIQKDLDIIKMRAYLNPSEKYKRNDMKDLPKFFQMGKTMDAPIYFYDRITNKERKRTIAEEIMNDEVVERFQKRQHSDVMERKDFKRQKLSSAKKNDLQMARTKKNDQIKMKNKKNKLKVAAEKQKELKKKRSNKN